MAIDILKSKLSRDTLSLKVQRCLYCVNKEWVF